ncbi:hypothetical protein HC022_15905, partial [Salipiger sp. HF18]|nr:hypothetical protein [Salipiger sp. HF18]
MAGLGRIEGNYRDGRPGSYLTEDIVADDSQGVGRLMITGAAAHLRDAGEQAGVVGAMGIALRDHHAIDAE